MEILVLYAKNSVPSFRDTNLSLSLSLQDQSTVPLECKNDILNTAVWPQGILVSKFIFPRSQSMINKKPNQQPFLGQRGMEMGKT